MVYVEIDKETPYAIWGAAIKCGNDYAVTICGGAPHIGAVSLAVYEPERDSATVSTITVLSHRDDVVASLAAKELARGLCCTVTVSVGIHMDNAGQEEIQRLRDNSAACCDALLEKIRG